MWYDHEFGGFSVPIIKESQLLNCGTHTIKLVIQDVSDSVVDSALFIESHSLQTFPFCKGDFNLDGHVDSADYVIWRNNAYHIMTGAKVTDGDGDGDGDVDSADYIVWRANYGCVGNGEFSADFNRDGKVDSADYVIWRDNEGLADCADRFLGDADGDGDVDQDDYNIWRSQFGSGASGSSFAASTNMEGGLIAELTELSTEATGALQTVDDTLKDVFLPLDGDADHDGDFDADDLPIIDRMLGV